MSGGVVLVLAIVVVVIFMGIIDVLIEGWVEP